MKKSLSLLAAFLVAGAFSAPAQAADHYVSGAAGVSWMNDMDIEASDVKNSGLKAEMGSGLTVLGAVGCDYGDWRLEAELGYQKNEVDKAFIYIGDKDAPKVDFDGDVSIISLMANGYYDIPLGGNFELSLGAGAGMAFISADNFGPKNVPTTPNHDFNETAFAWQIGAGFGIPVADNVMLDLRYRYFATASFDTPVRLPDEVGTDLKSETSISSHSALLGLRVGF